MVSRFRMYNEQKRMYGEQERLYDEQERLYCEHKRLFDELERLFDEQESEFDKQDRWRVSFPFQNRPLFCTGSIAIANNCIFRTFFLIKYPSFAELDH